MSEINKQSFICIYSNDTFDVYYDKDTKRYHIDVFDDGHYWDEVWFDEYKEEEVSMEKALENHDYKVFKNTANLEDYTYEEIIAAIDDFNRMVSDNYMKSKWSKC